MKALYEALLGRIEPGDILDLASGKTKESAELYCMLGSKFYNQQVVYMYKVSEAVAVLD
jgi:hypothetical protein